MLNCGRNYIADCWQRIAFLFINVTIFPTLHTGFHMILNYFYSNKLLVIRIFDNPQIFITMVTEVIPLWKVLHRKYSEITWWYVLWWQLYLYCKQCLQGHNFTLRITMRLFNFFSEEFSKWYLKCMHSP